MCTIFSALTANVTADMQHRFCLSVPKSDIRGYSCQDAGPYKDSMKRIISNVLDSRGSHLALVKFDFHGGMCLCGKANCNIDLPNRSLFTTPGTNSSPKVTAGMALIFVLFLCFI